MRLIEAAGVVAALAAGSAWAQSDYTVRDVGVPGVASAAGGVNASGEVAVFAGGASSAVFRFRGAALEPLAGLSGTIDVSATGIDSAGAVAGTALLSSGPAFAAFTTNASDQLVPIGTLGGRNSLAAAVSPAGLIVGSSGLASEAVNAFIYDPASPPMRSVDALARALQPSLPWVLAEGLGVSDDGTVAGLALNELVEKRAFVFRPGVGAEILPPLAGFESSRARAIGLDGAVYGDSFSGDSDATATRWVAGVAEDLGRLPGDARSGIAAVNARGEAVGFSAGAGGSRAVLWSISGEPIDLNTTIPPASGWSLLAATGINNNGQVVGVGVLNGTQTAFRLTLRCPADLSRDGSVDFNDFLVFLNLFIAQSPAVDYTGDGTIDFNDLLAFLNIFNEPC